MGVGFGVSVGVDMDVSVDADVDVEVYVDTGVDMNEDVDVDVCFGPGSDAVAGVVPIAESAVVLGIWVESGAEACVSVSARSA